MTGLSRALADHAAHCDAKEHKVSAGSQFKGEDLAAGVDSISLHQRDRRRKPIVVAVDPVGSILGGGTVGHYQVEGIG